MFSAKITQYCLNNSFPLTQFTLTRIECWTVTLMTIQDLLQSDCWNYFIHFSVTSILPNKSLQLILNVLNCVECWVECVGVELCWYWISNWGATAVSDDTDVFTKYHQRWPLTSVSKVRLTFPKFHWLFQISSILSRRRADKIRIFSLSIKQKFGTGILSYISFLWIFNEISNIKTASKQSRTRCSITKTHTTQSSDSSFTQWRTYSTRFKKWTFLENSLTFPWKIKIEIHQSVL